jgi:DNA-binding NarL/FixJ family response regulator
MILQKALPPHSPFRLDEAHGELRRFMRILVVDDNDRVRQGVIAILASRTNWEVCGQARDGAEAIQKVRELRPDLILLDISMPGMNGLDVARAVRGEMADAKILIMSQHDPASVLQGVLQAGANGCVDKSRMGTDLLSSIDSITGA